MSDETEKMVADALAQRFGIPAGEMSNAMGDNSLMTALALSLISRPRRERGDEDDLKIRRVAMVAMIVGACPRCLGDDAACAECSGKGKPGYRIPNKEALLSWIARPLRRLGLCVEARRQRPEHNHVGGYSQ